MSRALRAAAALALLLAGCRSLTPPAVLLAPGDPRPAALLATLGERSAGLSALRGMARLAVDGPGGSLRSRQVLVAARPALLRVEIVGFLSQTQALLVTDGETYAFFSARDRRFESDRVRPGLLWEIAGIDLEPGEAVGVLLGAPDLGSLAPARAASLGGGAVRVVLVDQAGRPRRALEFDAGGALRRLAAWDLDGVLAWDARYDDLETLGATSFAHAIEIEFPPTGVRARLELSRVSLNPDLAPDAFQLNPPPGLSHTEERGGSG